MTDSNSNYVNDINLLLISIKNWLFLLKIIGIHLEYLNNKKYYKFKISQHFYLSYPLFHCLYQFSIIIFIFKRLKPKLKNKKDYTRCNLCIDKIYFLTTFKNKKVDSYFKWHFFFFFIIYDKWLKKNSAFLLLLRWYL